MSQNFSTLHHPPFECDNLTTVTPNRARPGPLETRHLELPRHINFEEKKAQKSLQKYAQRSDQKIGKRQNRPNEVAKVGG